MLIAGSYKSYTGAAVAWPSGSVTYATSHIFNQCSAAIYQDDTAKVHEKK
jgi:hypothetical protein